MSCALTYRKHFLSLFIYITHRGRGDIKVESFPWCLCVYKCLRAVFVVYRETKRRNIFFPFLRLYFNGILFVFFVSQLWLFIFHMLTASRANTHMQAAHTYTNTQTVLFLFLSGALSFPSPLAFLRCPSKWLLHCKMLHTFSSTLPSTCTYVYCTNI